MTFFYWGTWLKRDTDVFTWAIFRFLISPQHRDRPQHQCPKTNRLIFLREPPPWNCLSKFLEPASMALRLIACEYSCLKNGQSICRHRRGSTYASPLRLWQLCSHYLVDLVLSSGSARCFCGIYEPTKRLWRSSQCVDVEANGALINLLIILWVFCVSNSRFPHFPRICRDGFSFSPDSVNKCCVWDSHYFLDVLPSSRQGWRIHLIYRIIIKVCSSGSEKSQTISRLEKVSHFRVDFFPLFFLASESQCISENFSFRGSVEFNIRIILGTKIFILISSRCHTHTPVVVIIQKSENANSWVFYVSRS